MVDANVISHVFLMGERRETRVNITFSDSDDMKTKPHDNNPVVISVQHDNWDIKRVFIDLGSSGDFLFRDAF